MTKPLVFRLCAAMDRLLGRERWRRLIERAALYGFNKPGLRRILENNLRRIYAFSGKELTEDELARVIDEMALLYARNQHSLFICDQDIRDVLSTFDLDLLPTLRTLRAGGRGALLITPHFGNIGLAMLALADAGIPLNAQIINAAPYRWCERPNLRFIGLSDGAAACLKALKRNETLLLYGDLDFFPGNRTADFFGAPIRPPHGPARLAVAARSPVLPVYAVYRGGRHHFECGEPILIEEDTDAGAVEEGILRSMETVIARHPSQWTICMDIWDMEETYRGLRRHLQKVRGGKLSLAEWLTKM